VEAYRRGDPVQFCRHHADPLDREVVGLLAAFLAFGRVAAFLPKIRSLIDVLGPRPRRTIEGFHPDADRGFFDAFRHRVWKGDSIRLLLANLRDLLREHGSIQEAFLGAGSQGPPGGPEERTGSPADDRRLRHRRRISGLARLLTRADPYPWTGARRLPRSYTTLVVDPAGGSAAKRWNLFLRWMVRPDDGTDLGLWKGVSSRDLVIPMDVHVGRISALIGLRRRRSLDWAAAEEVTRGLARIDPEDPLRFDFALSHLGISAGCRGRHVPGTCGVCDLGRICRAGTPIIGSSLST